MIPEDILEYIIKLTRSEDREMRNMGEVIFLGNNPTNEDICKLNGMKGYAPILDDYQDMVISDMIKNADLEANIL